MLACPHARIDNELELSVVKLKKSCTVVRKYSAAHEAENFTREAVKVNGAKERKEFDSMLRELREVLVDHLKGALKNILHDSRYLILHESL